MFKTDTAPSWQQALADAITEPAELLQILELNPALPVLQSIVSSPFPLRVPREFVARMQKGNLYDPLLQQVLPLTAELKSVAGYSADPLQEKCANPVPGLLHKYHGRALLTFTSACAIHCRYCFRREFPYQENRLGPKSWQPALEYLRLHPEIEEIILSGGDPLVANDNMLRQFGEELLHISHIRTLRFHSRLPIVLPSRMTESLLDWLKNYPLRKVMVIHCNHAQEIDESVTNALNALRLANVTLLNQSVLLKQINDKPETLIALSQALWHSGVLPYYLHQLDKVNGTAHFAVSDHHAKMLHKKLQEKLPGYLVPKLVREIPGQLHKVLL